MFFVDECGQQVGPTVGYVPRSEMLYACCAATAYSLDMSDVLIPQDADQLLSLGFSDGMFVVFSFLDHVLCFKPV